MEIFNQGSLNITQGNAGLVLVLTILIAWSIAWKGLALWHAARLTHKWWFIVILIVSSLGVLEIIYIFLIARKYSVESKEVKGSSSK